MELCDVDVMKRWPGQSSANKTHPELLRVRLGYGSGNRDARRQA